MKLRSVTKILEGYYELSEGVIPAYLTMTLERIISDGKITDPVQTYVLGSLVELFKGGIPVQWPRDLNPYEATVSAAAVDDIKNLSNEVAVALSEWLLEALKIPASFESNPFSNPAMNTVDWVKWVLSRQN